MTKISIFLILALISLKGTYGLTQSSLNDLSNVLEEYTLTINDIKEFIASIEEYTSFQKRNYEEKSTHIIDDKNLNNTIQELEDKITITESENENGPKNCVTTARKLSKIANNELQTGIETCISKSHEMNIIISSTLKDLEQQAHNILSKLLHAYNQCSRNEVDIAGTVKCLKKIEEHEKSELSILKNNFPSIQIIIQLGVDHNLANLDECLEDYLQDFKSTSTNIIDDLNLCIQKDEVTFADGTTKSLLDILKELTQNIKNIIHLLSHLPTNILEIPDKINEILSHINISVIVSQLRREVFELIQKGGHGAEKCRPGANKQINDLVKSAEKAANVCRDKSHKGFVEIRTEFSNYLKDAKQLLFDLNNQTLECILNSKFNPIEISKCLETHIEYFKNTCADLKQKATDAIERSKEKAKQIIDTLAACVNEVQIDTVQKGQDIITDTEKCIKNNYY